MLQNIDLLLDGDGVEKDIDAIVVSKEDSTHSLSPEMMEMMLDEGLDAQEDFLPRFQNMSFSSEVRRKVIKNCLDLKRLLDKESSPIPAESTIQKCLFSKSGPCITSLFRCLKVSHDLISGILGS